MTKHTTEHTDAYTLNNETGSYVDIEEASLTKHTAEHMNANILNTQGSAQTENYADIVTNTVKNKPWSALFDSVTRGSQSCT